MKLLVQEFLETHSFKELQEQHGVYASFSKSGHKFSLNYDQLEAKESDPLAQECRGLILALPEGLSIYVVSSPDGKIDYSAIVPGKTEILAYPMKRFFNYGQGSAAQINWHDLNLAVLEKLDGTLCIVYYDWGISKWCVATRSVPEADLLMDNGLFTFRTLFEKALFDTTGGLPFDQFSALLDKNYTYCFELTTPYNRIVVAYPENRITMLAARKISSLKEVDPCEVQITGIPVVQAHTYSSIDELVNWVSSLNPMEHEGVVVRDSNFNRIKVKNAAYVAYNKLHDRLGSSERNCMEFVLLEKDDDVAQFLAPEIGANMANLKKGLQEVIREHDDWYKSIRDVMKAHAKEDKKSFALLVQEAIKNQPGLLWQAPFFQMFDGKASSMKDFIMKNRKDGTWGDSFIDRLLELSKTAL